MSTFLNRPTARTKTGRRYPKSLARLRWQLFSRRLDMARTRRAMDRLRADWRDRLVISRRAG